jgi:uncharacterized protein with PQ loop repeat
VNTLVSALGYAGAAGSLLVGVAQLVKIVRRKSAKDVSLADYLIRVVASILLGIYATSMMDTTFLVVNFGSAALSLAVGVAAWRAERRRAGRSDGTAALPPAAGEAA